MKRIAFIVCSVIISSAAVVLSFVFRDDGAAAALFMLAPAFFLPAALKRAGGLLSIIFCGTIFAIILQETNFTQALTVFLFCSYISMINGVAGNLRNKLKVVSAKVQHLKIYDGPTKTYTRNYISGILEMQMKNSDRHNTDLTICCIGLDNLDIIIERFGPAAGEAYIKIGIEAVRKNVRDTDPIGRIGKNKFLVVFDRCSLDFCHTIIYRVRDMLKDQEVHNTRLGFSFGIAPYDIGLMISADELIGQAESIMERQKSNKSA